MPCRPAVGSFHRIHTASGFSASNPVDAGTAVPDPSDDVAVRDALARLHDFAISYDRHDGWRLIEACRYEPPSPAVSPEMRTGTPPSTILIASRSRTCHTFQEESITPSDAQYVVSPTAVCTFLD